MKKKYTVEFIYSDGNIEKVELTTENIEWSISQWYRNRNIAEHKILEEQTSLSPKGMLLG